MSIIPRSGMFPPLFSRLTDSSCKLEREISVTHMVHNNVLWSDPIYNQISRIFCLPGNRFQTISCKILLFLFLLCQSFSIPRTWLIQPPYPTKMAAVCSQKKSQKNLQFANNIIIKNCHLIKLAPLIFTSSELTKEVLGRMLSQTVKRQREITTKPLCEFGIKAENKSATTEASVSSIFPLLPKLCGIPESSSQ